MDMFIERLPMGWLPEMFHLGMSFLFNTLNILVEIMLRLTNMFFVFGYLLM
jgi:hypothetical protein